MREQRFIPMAKSIVKNHAAQWPRGAGIDLNDLFYISMILLICFKLTYNVTHAVDILFADESRYLDMGYGFKWDYFFRDGFIYFIWLKMLSVFIPDMVLLYCFNYAILISLNPVLMYILTRKMGKGPFISALFAIFFLVSALNVFTWPFITRFAVSIILLTFITIVSVKKNKTKYLTALAGLVLLLYVRPEFVLSLVMFAAAAIIFLTYRYYRTGVRRYGYLLVITLAVTIFVLFFKNPADKARSVMAFGQHYAVHLQERGNINVNPWTNWRGIMKEKFKTDGSMAAALINNPTEMTKHIFRNIKHFPPEFFYQMFPYNSSRFGALAKQIIKLLIILLFLIPGAYFLKPVFIHLKNKHRNLFRRCSDNDKYFYFLSALVTIPVIISIFVIYPRTHYMLVLFAVICPALVKNFPGPFRLPRYDPVVKKIAIVIILYFLPWKVSGSSGLLPGKPIEACTYLKRVAAVKKIAVQRDVRFSGMLFKEKFNRKYFRMYLENNRHHRYQLLPVKEDVPFPAFIEEKKINMIFVNKALLNNTRLSLMADDDFQKYISRVTGCHWTRFGIPACKEYILVKTELILLNNK